MFYEMLSEPPTPGTPLESLMLLVWRARQDIELYKTRAIVVAIQTAALEGEGSDKQLQDAWKELLDEMYPFQKGKRVLADKTAMDFLKQESSRGPLIVTPLQPLGHVHSKLKTRQSKRMTQ
jgi:hypothetical protein